MRFLKSLVPRVILACLFVALVLLAANPLLKYSITQTGAAITGTDFSVGNLNSSYSEGYIALRNCAAGHPFRAGHHLFEADTMVFEFDKQALSRKQFLVHQAIVDGLQLGTKRHSSGLLNQAQASEYELQLAEDFEQNGLEWLERADRQLQQQDQLRFASAEHANSVFARWPEEMQAVRERATAVSERVDHLKTNLQDAGENPLRNLEPYVQAIAEAENLIREMDDLRSHMSRMEQQLLMDQEELTSLREADMQRVAHDVDVLGLNSDELSHYLLGPDVGSWVGEAVGWIHWGRRFLPALGDETRGRLARGEDIRFDGCSHAPGFWIENMVLRGAISYADQAVNFEGRVANLSSDPTLVSEPTELIIQTTSEVPLLVQAKLSHGADGTPDEVIINLPSHRRVQRTLGNEQQFAISVAPTPSHIWMHLQIDGDKLSGKMIIKERPESLSLAVRNRGIGEALSRLIDEALEDVTRIDVEVGLEGTLDHPQWNIKSNLGPQLAVSMRTAVEQRLIQRRRAALVKQMGSWDERLLALGDQLSELKQTVIEKVDNGTHDIAQVRQTIASRVEDTDGLIEPNSPLREVFRR